MPVRNVAITERLRFDLEKNRINERLETPFLMILGGKDTLVDGQGARSFADSCFKLEGENMRKVIEYDDLGHMIIHDGRYLPEL